MFNKVKEMQNMDKFTVSTVSTSCLIPPALHKTPCWWCDTL